MKAEYQQIFSQLENEIENLQEIDNFYDYEKEFLDAWRRAGKALFQESLGKAPKNRRKKNC